MTIMISMLCIYLRMMMIIMIVIQCKIRWFSW